MALNFKGLQDEVLNHGFDVTYRPRVKVWLNEAQHLVARRVILPEMVTASVVTTTVGNASVPLPSDAVRVQGVVAVDVNRRLDSVTLAQMDGYETARSGRPLLFAVDEASDSLLLYPKPDGEYQLKIRYLGVPTDMESDTDFPTTPAAYQGVLVTYALSRAYRSEDDFEMANQYTSAFDEDLARLATDVQYRDMASRKVPGMWDY